MPRGHAAFPGFGVVMFCFPFLQGLLETRSSHIARHLVLIERGWMSLVDVMLNASLFVLGGNFWDKLRALFVRDALAVFPDDPNTIAATPLLMPAAG